MNKVFGFGETVAGYEVRVFNEREVRAAAGILLFFALVSFMNAFLLGNFYLTQIFIVAFLTDFTIRLFINPAFSPSMILGRFAVRKQTPEYVGAAQKRFAWGIGWVLALLMFYLMVLNHVLGPINMLVCGTCILLMFFESAFGICLGCKLYPVFFREKATHCPGDACELREQHAIQKIGFTQTAMVVLFLGLIGVVGQILSPSPAAIAGGNAMQPDAATADACTPPDWAVKMGHGEMWKLHHNCK